MRTANYKASCRIDKVLCILVHKRSGQYGIQHILFDVLMDLLLAHIRIMLGGNYHGLQTHRPSVLVILHGHLALAVGPQICKRSVLAHLSQLSGQLMGQRNRVRHILLGLVGSIAEHHALVAGADGFQLFLRHPHLCRRALAPGLQGLVHAHGNIRGLLVNSHHHRTSISIKAILRLVIADLLHRIPHQLLNIHISAGRDLSGHQHEAGAAGCLTGHAAHGILFHQSIQNRV